MGLGGSYAEYIEEEEAAAYAEAARTGQNDRWKLTTNEKLWVRHQPYLLEKGYQLRPRYRPGWVRSWEGTNRNPKVCEDSLTLTSFKVIDAIRVSDGKRVIVKAFDTEVAPNELQILQYLAAEDLQSNPRNHCAYALDSFPVPGRESWMFVVMDNYSSITIVPFETIGDVVELTNQLLEGLTFMHSLNLAHRDCAGDNIVMKADTLFKSSPHPHPNYEYLTEDGRYDVGLHARSGHNVKYYFIDFGLSTLFPNNEVPKLVTGAEGRERDIPELSTPDVPYDPFKLDVCIIGRFLERDFCTKSNRTLSFLEPLLKRMTDLDASKRPTAAEAFAEFELVRETLDPGVLARSLNPNFFHRSVYALFDCFSWFAAWFRRCVLHSKPQSVALP